MTFDYRKAVSDFQRKVYCEHDLDSDDVWDNDALSDAIATLESWQADAELAEYELGMDKYDIKYPMQMPGAVLNSDDETRAYVANVIVEASAKIEAYIPEAEKILADFVTRRTDKIFETEETMRKVKEG